MKKWIIGSLWGLFFCMACADENPSIQKANLPVSEISQIVPQSFDSAQINKLSRFFKRYHNAGVFNGNVLVYNDGRLYRESFGFADYIKKTPLQDSSLFQLASVSKPLTAIAIMKLVEQGKLKITDSVQVYLTRFPYPGITVEMLLSHRSGLSNYMYITDSLWKDQSLPLPNANMVDTFFTKAPLKYYSPNTRYNYSNTNYFLLAAIAEKIEQRPFDQIMNRLVFEPSGMHQSRIYSGMKMDTLPYIARGSENKRWHIADFYLNGVTGDKGAYSTTTDLMNLHLALQHNELLADSTIKEMTNPRSPFKKGKSYALGWRIMQPNEELPEIHYHFGWWRGYRSYFLRIPSENKCLVALCNLSRGEFLPKNELVDLLVQS